MKAAIFGLLAAISCAAQLPERDFSPPDLWREIDGVTNCIRGPGWNDFYFPTVHNQFNLNGRKSPLAPHWFACWGRVIEVQPTGIRVSGHSEFYGAGEKIFFVEGYPYEVEEDQYIERIAAKDSGVYTYTTVLGGTSTIRRFVYGRIVNAPTVPPPSPEQLKALADAEARKKAASDAKALNYNRDLAERGDAYGQFRMGERYRDGDGVDKDPRQAREWFAKASAQGDKAASKALAAMSQN